MKTWMTKWHKSPAQPLQCLRNLGTIWKAVCPFWLSWALPLSTAILEGHIRCSCTWLFQMKSCAEYKHAGASLSLASDSHWHRNLSLLWLLLVSVYHLSSWEYCSRKCGIIPLAFSRVRKIKATLSMEIQPASTLLPSPLKQDLCHCTKCFLKFRQRENCRGLDEVGTWAER